MPTWATALAAAIKAIATLLGLIQSGQERQAGRDEIRAADAEAEAAAQRKISEIATQGQTNDQTQADLDRGEF